MSDYISKSAVKKKLVDDFCADCTMCGEHCRHDDLFEIIDNQPTVDEKEIIRKPFERVIEQLNGLMPIQFNGFGKTLITVEDVIKILKEECGINE